MMSKLNGEFYGPIFSALLPSDAIIITTHY